MEAPSRAVVSGPVVTTPNLPYISEGEYKAWHQAPAVFDWLGGIIKPKWKVLELGSGRYPFKRADVHIDFDVSFVPKGTGIELDVSHDPIPFPDKHFDFVYARHLLEDVYDPFFLCEEMSRVAKAGFIETPSPAAEMARGVDGNPNPGDSYRGYHHHRYIIWNDNGVLHIVPKFPLVEYIRLDDLALCNWLRQGTAAWNTYFPWTGEVKYKRYDYPMDYSLGKYGEVLDRAINEGARYSMEFSQEIEQPPKDAKKRKKEPTP